MADETKTADEAPATPAAGADASAAPSKGGGGVKHTSPALPAGTTAPALVPRPVPEPPKTWWLAAFGGVLVLAGLFHLVLFVWPKFIEPTQQALTISIAVAVVCLAASPWVWAAWIFVGGMIGRTFTMVAVSLLYFVVLPFFQFLRSGDPLRKQLSNEKPSYWEDRDAKKHEADVEKTALPF